ncbi:MAG: LytR/AlgR family response regulator transcription factor [Burkholderiales bacterium]
MSEALRILVVDDEAPARSRLRDLLRDCAAELPLEVAGEAANGAEAIAWLNGHPADVVLLDIRMPVMDGLEAARHIQRFPAPPAVIFVTAFDQHAVDAFEVNAIDYLLKPVRRERLLVALRKAQTMSEGQAEALRYVLPRSLRHVSVFQHGRIHLIPLEDILYLRAELKYVTVRTAEKEFLLEESLNRLEEEFAGHFVRIHRNCLVARGAVAGFEKTDDDSHSGWAVVLKATAEKLPVSRRQQPVIKEFTHR